MTHARIALLSAAAGCLILLATPVLAQTYTYPAPAPDGSMAAPGYYYNGGPPVAGPVMGATPVTAVGPAMVYAAPAPAQMWCRVDKDISGRLTALCGPP
jgi:hypothetical protein